MESPDRATNPGLHGNEELWNGKKMAEPGHSGYFIIIF